MSLTVMQEALHNDEVASTNSALLRSLSVLGPNEFDNLIRERYGACWGTLKFEDSLSDYSDNVCLRLIFKKNKKES